MNVIVFGATGDTGRDAVDALMQAGHRVTAFVRSPDRAAMPDAVRVVQGDALDAASVSAAVAGHDAAVVTLGIRENPVLVLIRGARATSTQVRSEGTRNIIAAMREHGVRRLVVQTTFGVGPTRGRLPLVWQLFFSLILRPQIADTEVQEELVRNSGLDWVVAQPVSLADGEAVDMLASDAGVVRSLHVPRRSVARFLADAVVDAGVVRQVVALSG